LVSERSIPGNTNREQLVSQKPTTETMADIKDDPDTTTKGTGPSSIKFPMLNSSNYTVWTMRMKIALKINKVWEAIDPGNKHEEKNNMAIALLLQSIPEALTFQGGDLDTAKFVWDAIKAR